MKGAIFNIFENFIEANWGAETYECIYAAAMPKLETKCPFVGPGTYPDADFLELVGHAVRELNVTVEQATSAFGQFAFAKLAEGAPVFVKGFRHPKPFLKTIDDVIHVEVKKMHPGSVLPKFWYEDTGPDKLLLCYQSPRKFYHFVEGMIKGVGDHFGVATTCKWSLKANELGEFAEYNLVFAEPA